MSADGFNPVMAMLDLIQALSSCRDNGCGCTSDDDVETARDVIAWLTSELSERKMRSHQRPSKRPSNPSSRAPSNRRPPPPSTPAVHPPSSTEDGREDDLSLSLRSESESASEGAETSTESAGERPSDSAVHARIGARTTAVDGREDGGDEDDEDDRLFRAMILVWDPFGGSALSGSYRGFIRAQMPTCKGLAAERALEPIDLWREASDRFRGDAEVKRKRLGLPTFCNQFAQWVDAAPAEEAEAKPLHLRPLPPAPPPFNPQERVS